MRRILLFLFVIGLLSTGEACGQSDGDEIQFEIDCLAWQHETPHQRFLNGPKFRDACLHYLNSRSPKQIAADEAFEQKLLEDAQKAWGEYEKEHGTAAQPTQNTDMSDHANPKTFEARNMTSPENLILSDRCLAVFVDDTGHEALVPDHPVYGLGGCAVMGRDLVRLIWQPWGEIRKRVTGSLDTPLHANKFPSLASPADMEAVAAFFRVQPFARFGAIITINTKLSDELSLMRTMKEVLQLRINDIVQHTLCREVKVIFEASHRTDKLIQDAFQDFEVRRGPKHIPSECYFMPKAAAEPALEVADFVMHAIGRQARQNLKEAKFFLPDFKAVFHEVDPRLVSFMEVKSVTKNEETRNLP